MHIEMPRYTDSITNIPTHIPPHIMEIYIIDVNMLSDTYVSNTMAKVQARYASDL